MWLCLVVLTEDAHEELVSLRAVAIRDDIKSLKKCGGQLCISYLFSGRLRYLVRFFRKKQKAIDAYTEVLRDPESHFRF